MKQKLLNLINRDWQNFLFNFFFAVWVINILWPKVPLLRLGLGTPVRVEDFLFAVLALAFAGALLLGKVKFTSSPLDKPLVIFLWIGFLATLFGSFVFHTISLKVGLLHFLRRVEYLSFFYFGYLLLDSLPHLRRVITSFFHVSILVSLIAFLQVLNLFPLHVPGNHPSQDYVFFRHLKFVNSTFGGHYDLASFYLIVFSICLAFIIFLFFRSYWLRLAGLTAVLGSFPFYLTFGRSAVFGTLVGLATLLFIKNKKLLIIPAVLGSLVVLLFSSGKLSRYKDIQLTHGLETPRTTAQGVLPGGLGYQVVQSSSLTVLTLEYQGKTYEVKDPSIGPRIARWPLAIGKFTQYPLFGAGYSIIGEGYDGDYIRLIAEIGLFGLAAFLVLMGVVLKAHWEVFKRVEDRVVGVFSLGMLAATVGLLLNAVFIDVFEASKIAVTFWSLTGLALRALKLADGNT